MVENVRTEFFTGDSQVGDALNSGPPFRVQKDGLPEPVRDGLLADRRTPTRTQSSGKGRLVTPGYRDSLSQRGNVRFLHEHERYTRNLVGVNKNARLTADKGPCTVLDMASTKRRRLAESRPKKAPAAQVGPDGLTVGQRVSRLMIERDVGQTELARMCSQIYASFVPGADDMVKQQHIFNLLRKDQSSAWCLPLIAVVFEVSDLWLQYGIGRKERKAP